MKFNELIKMIRVENKMSINYLAKKIDMSPSYLLRLERGDNKNPSIELIIKLCDELNIDYTEMINCFTKKDSDYTPQKQFIGINNKIKNINNQNSLKLRDIVELLEEVDKEVKVREDYYIIAIASKSDQIIINIGEWESNKFYSIRDELENRGYSVVLTKGEIIDEDIYTIDEAIELFKEY